MTLSNGQTEPHPPTSSVVSTAGICLAFNPAMRALCLAAAAVGVATAFTPNSLLATRTLPPSTAHQIRNRAATPSFTDAAQPRSHRRELRASEGAQGRGQHGSAEAVGVIVCDHGSRRANANEMLFEVAERYRSFAGFEIVEVAHMELAQPTIEEAFDRCVAAGAQKVVLHPFFLSPGRHVTSDIPALMKAAAKRHPEVAWVVSEPLGLQELMPRVMHAAVSESVARDAWRYADDGSQDGGGV